jgi:hypothetical protein
VLSLRIHRHLDCHLYRHPAGAYVSGQANKRHRFVPIALLFHISLPDVFGCCARKSWSTPNSSGNSSTISVPSPHTTGPWLPAAWAATLLTGYLLDRTIDVLLFCLVLVTPVAVALVGELIMNAFFFNGFSRAQESFGGNRRFSAPRAQHGAF